MVSDMFAILQELKSKVDLLSGDSVKGIKKTDSGLLKSPSAAAAPGPFFSSAEK